MPLFSRQNTAAPSTIIIRNCPNMMEIDSNRDEGLVDPRPPKLDPRESKQRLKTDDELITFVQSGDDRPSKTEKRINKHRRYSKDQVMEVLKQYYIEGESIKEAGNKVGVPKSTAHGLIKRYKGHLKPPPKRPMKAKSTTAFDEMLCAEIRHLQINHSD
ncbi:hypothetical protein BX666DRAFT_2032965 [Dichotomocladium elegans]|nr:hypothetical protein BX666DRAFT_2032965 [Dichotomocladium elegans]